MSQQDVKIVLRAFEAFEREDPDSLLRHYDSEIEWPTTGAWLERATYRGHEGVRTYLDTMLDEFDELRIEPEEPRPLSSLAGRPPSPACRRSAARRGSSRRPAPRMLKREARSSGREQSVANALGRLVQTRKGCQPWTGPVAAGWADRTVRWLPLPGRRI